MQRLRLLRPPGRRSRQPRNSIDLGGGRFVPPEDVLEGHFRRLALATAAATATSSSAPQTGSQEVHVQLGRNLKSAIRVMAPGLEPLTQIAEELATKFTTVTPAPHFRSELHRALEAAHRQQIAQRTLGTRPSQSASLSWLWYAAAGGFVAALVAVLLITRRRQ